MTRKHNHKKHGSGVSIRAPKGFYFQIHDVGNESFYIRLFKRGSKPGTGGVGYIHLARVYGKNKWLATHSSLNVDYHNKGFGARLYARAIQFALDHGYHVKSSGGSSDMAQRVWRGHYLRKWFRIKTKRQQPGAYSDTWYAYAK